MSRRIEHSRRHGHWDPRWYTPKAAAPQDGKVSVVAGHDSPTRGLERSTGKRATNVAFRHELCDTHGNYVGTFVTEAERWQIGDAFIGGDGQALRIIGISAAERSSERPAFADRWNVEPNEAGGSELASPAAGNEAARILERQPSDGFATFTRRSGRS